MIQHIEIDKLKPHPMNDTFFDDMPPDKWSDFIESIRTSGIIEPIIATSNYVIVSGHQRLKAAKELKFKTVPVVLKEYSNDDEVLKDLIETNIRQRGTINSSSVKSAKIIKTLESIYHVGKKGNASDTIFTPEELAARLGISKRTLGYIKQLENLPPEMLELIENKKITSTTALRAMEGLTPDEQAQVIAMIQSSGDKRVTGKAIKDYSTLMFDKDCSIAKLGYRVQEQNAVIERLQKEKGNTKRSNYEVFLRSATYFKDNLETLSHAGANPLYVDISILSTEEKQNLMSIISTINDRIELVTQQILKSGEEW